MLMPPMLILPVANGVLPRPNGGTIAGMFAMEQGKMLAELGVGRDLLVCPWVMDSQSLYPVGVLARLVDIRQHTVIGEHGQERAVLLAVLEGREHARWHSLRTAGGYIFSSSVEVLDLQGMRKEYPVISGAGWSPAGGYTEFRDKSDIPVTIYGTDLMTGEEVSITANLGGLVEQEQAHTIEHAIIRALKVYGLCSVRTLLASIARETDELKQTLEFSIKYTMPEFLGVTSSGVCGNPMTNLAHFYLAKEFVDNVRAGKSLDASLAAARRSTMSQLTQELGLTMQQGLRTLQGLKKGMSHDDTPLKVETCKKVISRFPFEPWG